MLFHHAEGLIHNPWFPIRLLLSLQGRNKLLKSGGARHWLAMWIFKILGEFVSFPSKKQGVHVHPWHPQYLRPWTVVYQMDNFTWEVVEEYYTMPDAVDQVFGVQLQSLTCVWNLFIPYVQYLYTKQLLKTARFAYSNLLYMEEFSNLWVIQ